MSTMAFPPFMSARLSDLLAYHIHALAAVELFKNFATPAKAGAHMWTALCLQDAAQGFDRIACSHMSGLLDAVARDRWPRWFPRPELRTRQR